MHICNSSAASLEADRTGLQASLARREIEVQWETLSQIYMMQEDIPCPPHTCVCEYTGVHMHIHEIYLFI